MYQNIFRISLLCYFNLQCCCHTPRELLMETNQSSLALKKPKKGTPILKFLLVKRGASDKE